MKNPVDEEMELRESFKVSSELRESFKVSSKLRESFEVSLKLRESFKVSLELEFYAIQPYKWNNPVQNMICNTKLRTALLKTSAIHEHVHVQHERNECISKNPSMHSFMHATILSNEHPGSAPPQGTNLM